MAHAEMTAMMHIQDLRYAARIYGRFLCTIGLIRKRVHLTAFYLWIDG